MENQRTTRTDETSELLAVLADRNRRIVLDYFRGSSAEVASIDDLADEVTERGAAGDPQAKVVLHHWTLPRLEEAGVVDFDPGRGVVRYRGHERLEALLEGIQDATSRGY